MFSDIRTLILCILLILLFCTHCGVHIEQIHRFCFQCGCKNRLFGSDSYEASAGVPDFENIEDAIRYYFEQNYTNQTIRCFLDKYHGIKISDSTLKRRIRKLGLKKCVNGVPDAIVRQMILREIEGAFSVRGYRTMWVALRCNYGLRVPRDQVNYTFFLYENFIFQNFIFQPQSFLNF